MHWRRCLQQVFERGGAIDVALAPDGADEAGSHLVWRVRILAITDTELLIEPPSAFGQLMPIHCGVKLVAVMTVGQNRWMFTTENLGPTECTTGRGRLTPALRLRLPNAVRRCQRRSLRVATGSLKLPEVELWPLLDPKSVVLAERACELHFETGEAGETGRADATPAGEAVMPEVGPRFSGTLANIGGGGVGVVIPPDHAQMLSRHKIFWLRLALPPRLRTPICASAKLVHTHMQSDQHVYAGMGFDFSFNARHQRLVVSQIRRYVAAQQGEQPPLRRSA